MDNIYIFSYGSLVNSESRKHTAGSALVGPVRVKELQRSWNMRGSKMTVLGCNLKPGAFCNGAVISIPKEELPKYDEREHLYNRIQIPVSDVDFLDVAQKHIDTVWVYVTPDPKLPDQEHPIAQSYVDVVLTGFLEFRHEFAKEFVDTTEGWSNIINDRDNPIYSRPLKELRNKSEVDELLKGIL